jgi:dinuclear metal center YbgI/SA1388 family protein
MTTVADILGFIETFAPTYMKEPWDNVGLNCGRMSKEVRKILVALDASTEACHEAAQIGADLLLTHHALVWKAGFVNDQTQWGRDMLFLIENGIACVNAHTNLDECPGGVNDELARLLGLENIEVINPRGVDANGDPWGLLHKGDVKEQTLEQFMELIKTRLGTPVLRYVNGGKPVRKVAVGGGACGTEFMDAVNAGCDTFVTADVKYNHFWDSRDNGMSIIDAGHFYTENPVVTVLAEKIRRAFPEITVEISKNHWDCMKFY